MKKGVGKALAAISLLVLCQLGYAQSDITVEIANPQKVQQQASLFASGSIEAVRSAQLASFESGIVHLLMVEIGDVVEQGQLLLRLDDTLAKLELESATAELEAAKVRLNEAQRLVSEVVELSKKQVVAQTLLDERRANLANAQALLARALANRNLRQEILNRHELKAPFSGVISQRMTQVGEFVNQQNPVLALVAQGHMRMSIAVSQEHLGEFIEHRDNIQVRIVPDTPASSGFKSKVERVVPLADANSRSFIAHLSIEPQYNAQVLPGMSATAELSFANRRETFTLPRSALKMHPDGGSSVFTVENNRAKRVLVEIERILGNEVAIRNLEPEKSYIISGVELIKDDMQVKVKSS